MTLAVVAVAAEESLVVAGAAGSVAVGDAGGLDDGGVVAHVVDDADEAVVQDGDGFEEAAFEFFGDGSAGGVAGFAELGDVGLLFGCESHVLFSVPGVGASGSITCRRATVSGRRSMPVQLSPVNSGMSRRRKSAVAGAGL